MMGKKLLLHKYDTINHLRLRKDGKSGAEVAAVVSIRDKALAVGCDHVD